MQRAHLARDECTGVGSGWALAAGLTLAHLEAERQAAAPQARDAAGVNAPAKSVSHTAVTLCEIPSRLRTRRELLQHLLWPCETKGCRFLATLAWSLAAAVASSGLAREPAAEHSAQNLALLGRVRLSPVYARGVRFHAKVGEQRGRGRRSGCVWLC